MPDQPRSHRGIATVCLSGTLEDKLTAAAEAGFGGVEILENDLIASPSTPSEIGERCADLGLSVDLYQPLRDIEAVPAAVFERNLRRAEHKFALTRQLGADTVLVCSSVSPDAVDDDDLAAEQLHALGARAAEHGVRVAYEALAWGRFVNTWERSWRIVARAGHPAVGLCLDSFHVLSRTSDITGIAGIPGDKLFFLQLADAPRLDMNLLQWSRHHRLFPGQGAFDLADFLDHVLRAGYRGPLSLEVFNDVFRQADPHRTAVDALRSLLHLEEAHRRRFPSSAGRDVLPHAPELAGHAFTEFVVDADTAPRIGRALATLGFAHTGRHWSKPVQLWRQGDARVLVNAARSDGTAEIGALGLESTDPARSASRAEALLAPVLPRTRGHAEADLPAISAPDGTSVFFCRTGADWLADFVPTGADVDPTVGLTRTDHVTLAQPFDSFDEATLFYRSTLGLEPRDDTEFAAPFGLMRSRSVNNVDGNLRIMLTGTLLRRGEWAPGVPDPQHVAFATDDIFASAVAMRARGAPLLSIPDNYYADLDARLAPSPDLLAGMREYGVLYDRDEYGEFLHLYTELIGSRVFVEVVQRVGGYAGYGTANAPVRMAAHRRCRLARPDPPGHRTCDIA